MKASENPCSIQFINKLTRTLSYQFNGKVSTDSIQDSYCAIIEKLLYKVSPSFDQINRACKNNQSIEITYSSQNGINKLSLEKLNSLIYLSVRNRLVSEFKRTNKTVPLVLTDSNGNEFFHPSIIQETTFEGSGKQKLDRNISNKNLVNELIKIVPQNFKEVIVLNCKLKIKQKEAAELLNVDARYYRVMLWRLKKEILPKNPKFQALENMFQKEK